MNTPGSNQLRDDVLHVGLQYRRSPMLIYLCEVAANAHKHIPSVDAHVHQEPHFLFLIRIKRNTHTHTVAQRHEHIFNTRIYEYERVLLCRRWVFSVVA